MPDLTPTELSRAQELRAGGLSMKATARELGRREQDVRDALRPVTPTEQVSVRSINTSAYWADVKMLQTMFGHDTKTARHLVYNSPKYAQKRADRKGKKGWGQWSNAWQLAKQAFKGDKVRQRAFVGEMIGDYELISA